MSEQQRYDALLQIRTPACLIEAIDKGADRNLVSRSAYIRHALVERLRADGVDPLPAVSGAQ